MTTYPRPVLDERPQTSGERNRASAAMAQRREMAVEMERQGPPPERQVQDRAPCGRCGRMFASDRVAKHEAVCVAKPVR